MTWTETPPHLHGDIVDVREIVDADAPALLGLLGDPAVAAHISAPPPTLDAFRGFIAWARQERVAGRGLCFGIVPHGLTAAVGVIQLRAQEPSWFTAQWGFAIGAAFWSTGAFFSAAQLVAAFAFDEMGVHRLEARAMVANGRGNGALQKLGASPEGELASAFLRDGRFSPQFLWGLHVEAWRSRAPVAPRFTVEAAQTSIASANEEALRLLRARGLGKSPVWNQRLYPFFMGES